MNLKHIGINIIARGRLTNIDLSIMHHIEKAANDKYYWMWYEGIKPHVIEIFIDDGVELITWQLEEYKPKQYFNLN